MGDDYNVSEITVDSAAVNTTVIESAPVQELNVLNGGVETLTEMKAAVIRLEELNNKTKELTERQKELQKDIASIQKTMENEISSTLSKRQAEVEKDYDSQVEKTRAQIKSVRNSRDKDKGIKVKERVSAETAELNEEVRALRQDLKGVFTKQHISRIFNTEYFFTLYMPDGMGDFLIIVLSIAILLAIPFGAYFIIPAEVRKIWMLIALYAGIILLSVAIFYCIFKNVYKKHAESFREAKIIRSKIAYKKKRIAKLEKSIRKDKDESGYGLEKYDEELAAFDRQMDTIIMKKKEALTAFEAQSGKAVSEEIRARYGADIAKLKAENETTYDELRIAEAQAKSLAMEISNKYTSYVGKENLSVAMIDNLIGIINEGEAGNVADAIAQYKKMQTEAKKEF